MCAADGAAAAAAAIATADTAAAFDTTGAPDSSIAEDATESATAGMVTAKAAADITGDAVNAAQNTTASPAHPSATVVTTVMMQGNNWLMKTFRKLNKKKTLGKKNPHNTCKPMNEHLVYVFLPHPATSASASEARRG